MRTGGAVVILLLVFCMTAIAGTVSDRSGKQSPMPAGGVMSEVKDTYLFAYSSRGGANIAKDMHMWETTITVDSRSGKATLDINRHPGDDAGQSIGRFEMTIEDSALERLRALLESANFTSLQPEGRYEMSNESLLTFTYKTAAKEVAKTVGKRRTKIPGAPRTAYDGAPYTAGRIAVSSESGAQAGGPPRCRKRRRVL